MQRVSFIVAFILMASIAGGFLISGTVARPTPASAVGTWTPPSPSPTMSPPATSTASVTPTASPPSAEAAEANATPDSQPQGDGRIVPTATSPPRLTDTPTSTPTPSATPTPIRASQTPGSAATKGNGTPGNPANPTVAAAQAGPLPSQTPPPPTATPTPGPPTATPTPDFDYVVTSLLEIPVAGDRNLAYVRGKLVDRQGQLVKGAQFEIRSDAVPQWTAVGPPAANADGTVVFPVTRGRFAVRVLGGRSRDAGWMVTGQPGQGQMSDWSFVFQTTH